MIEDAPYFVVFYSLRPLPLRFDCEIDHADRGTTPSYNLDLSIAQLPLTFYAFEIRGLGLLAFTNDENDVAWQPRPRSP